MGWILFNLASTYKVLGKHKEAQKLYEKTLKIYANYYHEDNVKSAVIMRHIAKIYLEEKRFDDAEVFIMRSLKVLQDRTHINAYRSLEVLGEIYLKKSGLLSATESQILKDKALDAFHHALKITEQNFPSNPAQIERIRSKIKKIQG